MDNIEVDIAIVGAGPAGSVLALGLAAEGLDVALLDARDPAASPQRDGRNFALVTGSCHLLDRVGIGQVLRDHGEALHGLEAVDGGTHLFTPPSVMFTDADIESADPDETLGCMIQAEPLQAALDDATENTPGIRRIAPILFKSLRQEAGRVIVCSDKGDELSARLLIGADGLRSAVRQALGISTEGRDYGKSVFTANVRLEHPHDGIARQLFLPEGPFAMLPLPDQRANLAWYMKRGAAEALAAYSPEEIELELNTRLSGFAGNMQLDGPAGAYPLILQLATEITGPRAALVGDAARRVNPLAGQGLNQGMRDVASLIEILGEAVRQGEDPGADTVLARYSEARRFEGLTASLALDVIDRLFSNDSMLTKPIRALGLTAANRIPALRRFLARRASATEESVPAPMRDW